jgi:VWFA-related protein
LSTDCAVSDDRISIYVEVTDKSGHPVSGLEARDFTLLDSNQPQQLIKFRAVDVNHPPFIPEHVLILIDAVDTDYLVVARARDGLSDFFKQSGPKLAYPTSIAILSNAGLKLEGGPTQDRDALLSALNNAKSALRVIGPSAGVYGAAERSEQSFNLIRDMISTEAKQCGRKLVLMVSPGWPMLSEAGSYVDSKHRSWIFDDIVGITNGMREASVSLYALDPSSFGSRASLSYESYLKGVSKITDAQYPDLALQVLAEHSGGQVILLGNDIEAEIKTAEADAVAYYRLTFRAAPPGQSVQYHPIRVKVDKPGLKVRTTAGYYTQVK